jgi:hypothetical protein
MRKLGRIVVRDRGNLLEGRPGPELPNSLGAEGFEPPTLWV